MFEQDKGDSVDKYVLQYFSSPVKIPYATFLVWIQFKISRQQYDEVCSHLSDYIKQNQYKLAVEEYDALMELLIFHGLCPLRRYKDAFYVLTNNKKLPLKLRKAFIAYCEALQVDYNAAVKAAEGARRSDRESGSIEEDSNFSSNDAAADYGPLSCEGASASSSESTAVMDANAGSECGAVEADRSPFKLYSTLKSFSLRLFAYARLYKNHALAALAIILFYLVTTRVLQPVLLMLPGVQMIIDDFRKFLALSTNMYPS